MLNRSAALATLVIAGALAIFNAPGSAQKPKPPGAEFTGAAFNLNKIQDGIYHAVGTGSISVGCNAAVIVNQDDVLVVDSHASPAAAWALAEQIKTITDKPIRFVVNTHYHWDHAHGNQIYGPEVEIIGHEFTRKMLVEGASKAGRSYPMFIGGIPTQIEQTKKQIAAASDEAARAKLRAQLSVQENYLTATNAVTVTPPTVTLAESMTLYRGGREIRLLFLGRGHTGGDLVVYLPKERVIATGDLLGTNPGYIGDAFITDWVATLEKLKTVEFDWVLPGHGPAFQGKAKIDQFQSYLRDFWSQAQKLHTAGVKADEAARQMDMRPHATDYPNIIAPGVLDHGVYRAYELMEGKAR
jgi:glyoxylase-like metal-dependent hydrolase (beta-lactamase superfamily II)